MLQILVLSYCSRCTIPEKGLARNILHHPSMPYDLMQHQAGVALEKVKLDPARGALRT